MTKARKLIEQVVRGATAQRVITEVDKPIGGLRPDSLERTKKLVDEAMGLIRNLKFNPKDRAGVLAIHDAIRYAATKLKNAYGNLSWIDASPWTPMHEHGWGIMETSPQEFHHGDKAKATKFIQDALGAGHKVYAIDDRPTDPKTGKTSSGGYYMGGLSVILFTASSDSEARGISAAWWKKNKDPDAKFTSYGGNQSHPDPVPIHSPADLHIFKW